MYRNSRIEAASLIKKGINGGQFVQKEDMDAAILSDIQAGFKKSNQTPRHIKRLF